MTSEQRNANVVLTADISGYTQATQEASKQTNLLLASVNKLTQSLDGITKKMGKKLLIFSAADLATLTAVSVVTAKYEKQLSTLRAQTEIAGKSFDTYKKGIDEISTSLPVARGEVVQLVTAIQNMGITSETEVLKTARVFEKMGAATGESVGALTQGLIELSRTMGTLSNGSQGLQNFSDEVVTLSSKLGVASTDILAFAQNITPFARAAGIGQKEILGLSAAFVRAGADSNAAATAFNQIMRDIVTLSATGSPELAKYSNAVGMTLDSFKELGNVEKFIAVIDAVTKSGDKGVQMLNNMGIDGVRAAKALAQLATAGGGLQKVIDEARGAYGNGSTALGAGAAWDTMADQLTRMRNIMEKFTSDIGDYTVPVAKGLLDTFNDILSVVTKLSGPILGLAGILAGAAGAISGVAGGILTAMGPLSTLMLVMTAFRLSPMRALLGGIGDAVNQVRGRDVPLSRAGQMTADGVRLPWYQRLPYAGGQAVGAQIGRLPVGAAAGFRTLGTLAAQTVGSFSQANAQWYTNARLPWWERQSTVFSAPDQGFSRGQVLSNALRHPGAFLGGMFSRNNPLLRAAADAEQTATDARMGYTAAAAGNKAYDQAIAAGASQKDAAAAAIRASNSMSANMKVAAERTAEYARNLVAAKGSQAALASAAGGAARSLVGVGVAAARMGVGLTGQAIAAPFRMLGGMFGGGAGLGMGIAAAAGSAYLIKQSLDSTQGAWTGEQNIQAFNAALGRATDPLGDFSYEVKKSVTAATSLKDAMEKAADAYRSQPKQEYTDPRVASLPTNVNTAIAYMQSMGQVDNEQMSLIIGDLAKRFAGTNINIRDIIAGYDNSTKGGKNPYGNMGLPLENLIMGFGQTVTEKQGWWQGIRGQTPDEARDLMGLVASQIVQERNQYTGKQTKYGLDLAQTVQASRTMQALQAADRQGIQSGNSAALQTLINTFAQGMGGQELFGMQRLEFESVLNDGGLEAVLKVIASSDNDAAKAFTKMLSLAQSPETLAKILRDTNKLPEFVANSALGMMEQRSRTVQAASSLGDASQNPNVIQNAYREIAGYLQQTSKSAAEITARTHILMNDMSPTSREFALNQAAMNFAVQRSIYTTSIMQGGMAGTAAQYQANAATIKFATNEDTSKQEQENFEIDQQTRDKAAQYYMFVKDFYRQRLYAAQDFARQLRYASEDAAKSMYDPFQRTSARGTQSSGMVATNLDAQLKKMRDQVKNLAILRKRGLSEATIRNLNLTDPSLADQVQRWVDEGGSFQAGQLNKKGGQARTDAAGAIVEQTDQFKRSQEQFDIQMDRGIDSLKLYGEEVLGNTQTVLKKTAGMLESLGISSTDYLTRLSDLAKAILNTGTPNAGSATIKDRALVAKAGDVVAFGTSTGYDKSGQVRTGVSLAGVSMKRTKTGWVALGADGEKIAIGQNKQGEEWYDWSKKQKEAWVRNHPELGTAATATNTIKNWSGTYTEPYGAEVTWFNSMEPGWENASRNPVSGKWTVMGPTGKIKLIPDSWQDTWDTLSGERRKTWYENQISAGNLAMGGIATNPTARIFGEAGPEAVIPLNSRGMQFMTTAMVRSMNTAGRGAVPSYKGESSTTVINKNTQFMGPITVQAQDPNEMARKLEGKKRLANMRRGANASI